MPFVILPHFTTINKGHRRDDIHKVYNFQNCIFLQSVLPQFFQRKMPFCFLKMPEKCHLSFCPILLHFLCKKEGKFHSQKKKLLTQNEKVFFLTHFMTFYNIFGQKRRKKCPKGVIWHSKMPDGNADSRKKKLALYI